MSAAGYACRSRAPRCELGPGWSIPVVAAGQRAVGVSPRLSRPMALLYADTASLLSGADAAIADGTRTSPSFRQVPGSSLLWDYVREFRGR